MRFTEDWLRRLLCTATVLWIALHGASVPTDAEPPPEPTQPAWADRAVVLVCRITGEASMRAGPQASARPLELFDRLEPGAVVSTAAGSQVVLVFFDGRRVAVMAESRAIVEAGGAVAEKGSVRHLEAVPAVADLPALQRPKEAGQLPGASRIRDPGSLVNAEIALYPCRRAAVPNDGARLFFTPVAGVEDYRVEVRDTSGQEVFAVKTTQTEIRIGPGNLRPGKLYYWQVASAAGHVYASALFRTLAAEEARALHRISEQTTRLDAVDGHLLLAQVEHRLGLRREACERLGLAALDPARLEGVREMFRCASESFAATPVNEAGLVVERVRAGYAAARAGLEPGDLLLGWSHPSTEMVSLATLYDIFDVEHEEAPRGPVRIEILRHGERLAVTMPPGGWRFTVGPRLDGEDARSYEEARRRLLAAYDDEALALWHEVAGRRRSAAEPAEALWWVLTTVGLEAGQGKWEQARASFEEATTLARSSGRAELLAWVDFDLAGKCVMLWGYGEAFCKPPQPAALLEEAARLFLSQGRPLLAGDALKFRGYLAEDQGDLPGAEGHYRRILEIRRREAPDSFAVATALDDLGWLHVLREELELAKTCLEESLALKDKLVPGSIELVRTLSLLGNVANAQGRSLTSIEYQERALRIVEELQPRSSLVSNVLTNLGLAYGPTGLGDLRTAEIYHRRALEIVRQRANRFPLVAPLSNLGTLAVERGDFVTAVELFDEALGVLEDLAPNSAHTAPVLFNLGVCARHRGDLAAAEDYFRRSLEIYKEQTSGSLTVAQIETELASLSLRRGDAGTARELLSGALEKLEPTPETYQTLLVLHQLGRTALQSGDPETARKHGESALEIVDKMPGSLGEADVLELLGLAALELGELDVAGTHFSRCLRIREDLAPESHAAGEAHYHLGRLRRRQGRSEPALSHFAQAREALESQVLKLGGTVESEVRFTASYVHVYRAEIEQLLELGRAERAFHVLEGFRAQGLRRLLAERDLVFSGVPAELDRERRLLNFEHDRLLSELGEQQGRPVQQLRAKLEDARRRQEDVRRRIRAASPRLAALQYPEPLGLEALRKVLDPGTLLLSYLVAGERGWLFAVGPGPDEFRVHGLAIGEASLRDDVRLFRTLIREGASEAAGAVSKRLGASLTAPAREAITRARRLVVVPDGPLHDLPFAALADPSSPRRYLVEAKPVSVVASATVLGELKARRRQRAQVRLAAFGDPAYPAADAGTSSSPVLRSLLRGLADLEPLPASRLEVERLRRLYPDRADVYLGPAATEERAKAVGDGASVLHFACHGFVDEQAPLESALALTIPDVREEGDEDRDNGLLQVWEIFEEVRLDADLVTLSACRTALGREMAGEGILGLTRAFQFAGARSVLASLWEVSDVSTAELMERFYRHWNAGRPKDEALRAAQLELLREPVTIRGEDGEARKIDASAPFHWAAFQVVGDWH